MPGLSQTAFSLARPSGISTNASGWSPGTFGGAGSDLANIRSKARLDGAKWAIEGQKVCTKYKGDDKDCYGIERTGDQVTLTDSKGNAYKLKVLPGNPKDL